MKQNILEELYNYLMEAKTPEQVLQALSNKFNSPYIAQEMIKQIMEIDPTKKYSYTTWAVSTCKTTAELQSINLDTLQKLFNYAQKEPKFQLQTFKTVDDAVDGQLQFQGQYEYEIVFDSADWIIYVPKTFAAERYICFHLYNGANWCTASKYGENHFNKYTQGNNKLYIIANKTNNKIYQYSPKTQEINDSDNNPLDFINQTIGQIVLDWFEEQNIPISQDKFPNGEDIYNGGYYGFKCIDDLYMKYALCNSDGIIHTNRNGRPYYLYNVQSYDEYLPLIVIDCVENGQPYTPIYNVEKQEELCALYNDIGEITSFKDKEGDTCIMGTDNSDSFLCINLKQNVIMVELYDCQEFDSLTDNEEDNLYYIIDTYDQVFIFDKKTADVCKYLDSYRNTYYEVIFNDLPIYNPSTNTLKGYNMDDESISYNLTTNKLIVNGQQIEESIKRNFKTTFNKINKSFNVDKIRE